MFLDIPALILLFILIFIIIAIILAVFGLGLFRVAEKEMADKVVPEEETDHVHPDSDTKKDKST